MTTAIYLLTGDIGGTNSRMALYDATASSSSSSSSKPLVEYTYRNFEQIPREKYSDPTVFSDYIVVPFLRHCWEQRTEALSQSTSSGNESTQALLAPLSQVVILATLATAGLVHQNRGNLTNLGNMLIDGNAMAANSSDEYLKRIVVCRVINDFVAQGYGCLTLQKHEVKHLYGPSDLDNLPVGPKVCIGAGTGLGECYLTPNDETVAATPPSKSSFFSSAAVSYKAAAVSYTCFASEGGHVEYAPRNDVEIEMFHYLQHKFSGQGRISVERVVSGVGLANVYEFLAATYPSRIVQSVHDAFLIAGDEQGRVVAQNAHAEAASSSSSLSTGSLCQQAMSIMMSAYGCEVGSAAIKWIPTGGLFVTGGLTPKNIDYIEGLHTDFMISYLHKGRVRPLLERVPLFAVMVEDLGVRGVHKAALMEYEKYVESSSMSSGPDQRRNNNSSSFAVAQLWEQIVNGGNTTSSASSSMLLVSSLVLTTAAVAGFVAGRAHHHRGRP